LIVLKATENQQFIIVSQRTLSPPIATLLAAFLIKNSNATIMASIKAALTATAVSLPIVLHPRPEAFLRSGGGGEWPLGYQPMVALGVEQKEYCCAAIVAGALQKPKCRIRAN
jgi:hypothetical protein